MGWGWGIEGGRGAQESEGWKEIEEVKGRMVGVSYWNSLGGALES